MNPEDSNLAGEPTYEIVIPNCKCCRLTNFELKQRLMNIASHIEINPAIMMGKPIIKGTRLTVELILESLSAGETMENLLESYPRLTRDDILAALAYAAETLKGEKIYPVII